LGAGNTFWTFGWKDGVRQYFLGQGVTSGFFFGVQFYGYAWVDFWAGVGNTGVTGTVGGQALLRVAGFSQFVARDLFWGNFRVRFRPAASTTFAPACVDRARLLAAPQAGPRMPWSRCSRSSGGLGLRPSARRVPPAGASGSRRRRPRAQRSPALLCWRCSGSARLARSASGGGARTESGSSGRSGRPRSGPRRGRAGRPAGPAGTRWRRRSGPGLATPLTWGALQGSPGPRRPPRRPRRQQRRRSQVRRPRQQVADPRRLLTRRPSTPAARLCCWARVAWACPHGPPLL
jgi:hypothetical protein